MDGEPLFDLRKVSKSFGATRALQDAGLTVYPGEVHGLLGTNGSGKSTMLKILSGFISPDDGAELTVRGKPTGIPVAGAYRRLGWGFVHQDLALYPSLRVMDNFHLSGPVASPPYALSWRREYRKVSEILERLHLDLDPRVTVDRLSQPQRALLAIARAMYEAELGNEEREAGDSDPREVLFLDESTVSLEARDRAELLRVIRRMTGRGSAVVIVSHDLGEVADLTDRVTVLRDGRVSGTGLTAELSESDLLTLVAGNMPEQQVEHVPPEDGSAQVVLGVADLVGPSVGGISFHCRQGEILGLTGLAGSGFDEVPYLLFGSVRAAAGQVLLAGDEVEARWLRPNRAISLGLVLVPGDRRQQGVVASATVRANVTLPSLERYRGFLGWVSRAREDRDTAVMTSRVGLVPPDFNQPVSAFSGGNQQKAVLAKWFNTMPKMLMLHEPTVGIDVRARAQVHELLRTAAGDGQGILCVSGDFEQLEQLCDRVLVMRKGRIRAELTGDRLTKTTIARESMNVSDD
jgi:ribose transport system ATP-binding protein